MRLLVLVFAISSCSLVYADKYTVTPAQVEGVTNIVCGLGSLFSKSACGDTSKSNNQEKAVSAEKQRVIAEQKRIEAQRIKEDEIFNAKEQVKYSITGLGNTIELSCTNAPQDIYPLQICLAEMKVFEAENLDYKNRLAAAKEEKSKEPKEVTDKEFLESSAYKKMFAVYEFLDSSKKITDAQKEQARQKKIGAQSGYVNTAAIYDAGVTIVDNTSIKERSFADYKSLGGTANNGAVLLKRHEDCKLYDWLYVAATGTFFGALSQEKRDGVISASKCY